RRHAVRCGDVPEVAGRKIARNRAEGRRFDAGTVALAGKTVAARALAYVERISIKRSVPGDHRRWLFGRGSERSPNKTVGIGPARNVSGAALDGRPRKKKAGGKKKTDHGADKIGHVGLVGYQSVFPAVPELQRSRAHHLIGPHHVVDRPGPRMNELREGEVRGKRESKKDMDLCQKAGRGHQFRLGMEAP